ncbi:MAG: NUDIX hydrolase [Anaerolineales bacterium]|nr:NUDIX hydrolase [Anaerolineales bacterium]
MKKKTVCPKCGTSVVEYMNPGVTADIIIEIKKKIVLIERINEPYGWAIPGGYVNYGESVEDAAIREAKEETGLNVKLIRQFHMYSNPNRDPRQHNVSLVFIASAAGTPKAGSDAKTARLFGKDQLPLLVFDHLTIVQDYLDKRY